MEKVKRRRARKPRVRKHRIRNLPLKWSFMLYVLLCAVVAIFASVSVATIFIDMQSDLYYRYEREYLRQHGLTEEDIDGSVIIDEDGILIYRTIGNIIMSSGDMDRYNFYGALAMLSIPIISLLCIVFTGIIFYNRKLKTPLHLIDASSARIAMGDLDFTIQYDNRNEMGRLAASFETMRGALQANHKELWRMMEQRKQLNAAFAHDLRTPLTVLKGYTEYLKTYVPTKRVTEEKLLSTIDLMHGYVVRLEDYTVSMSAMQKLEEITPNPQAIEFSALSKRLQSAADMLRGVYNLRFECAGEGNLSADADIITQVLENLVANAARYATSEIRVSFRRNDDWLQLTVSDDGPGFSQKILSKGLVPYNHLKDENMHAEHYGLGLYICSVLCERHGGELRLPLEEGMSCITATFANFR